MFTGIRFHKSEILVFCLLVSISGCSATGPNSTREIYPSALEAREISEEKKEAADSEEPSSAEAADLDEPSSAEATNLEEPSSEEATDSEEPSSEEATDSEEPSSAEAADSEEPSSEEASNLEEPSSEEATDSEEPSSEEAANSEGNSNLSDFDNPSKLDRKNTDIDLFVGTVTTLEQQSSSKSSAEIDIENNVLREELPKSEETFYIYIPED